MSLACYYYHHIHTDLHTYPWLNNAAAVMSPHESGSFVVHIFIKSAHSEAFEHVTSLISTQPSSSNQISKNKLSIEFND